MLSKNEYIEDSKNLAEEAARKVDFAKRFADKVEEHIENHSRDDAYNALYSLKDSLGDAGDAAINAYSKLKSLQDAERRQPEFVEENFMKAAEVICKFCKATEDYWITDCETAADGYLLGECPLAKLKEKIGKEKNYG